MGEGLCPDVIYINGDIVTLDESGTKAQAVATWRIKLRLLVPTSRSRKWRTLILKLSILQARL